MSVCLCGMNTDRQTQTDRRIDRQTETNCRCNTFIRHEHTHKSVSTRTATIAMKSHVDVSVLLVCAVHVCRSDITRSNEWGHQTRYRRRLTSNLRGVFGQFWPLLFLPLTQAGDGRRYTAAAAVASAADGDASEGARGKSKGLLQPKTATLVSRTVTKATKL